MLITKEEKALLNLLLEGENSSQIIEWMNLNYKDYLKIKHTLFKKLKITRTIQIFSAVVKLGLL